MRGGFGRLRPDFLLERPVDPESLRLLVLHALYSGPERRRYERAAMSVVVKVRTGLRAGKATLVDLSLRGCRLTSARRLPGRTASSGRSPGRPSEARQAA